MEAGPHSATSDRTNKNPVRDGCLGRELQLQN